MKKLKYFSTLLVAALAAIAVWLCWNYYMQSPWTRDGKVRSEQVNITPQVSGSILKLNVKDNQFVKAGDVLFEIDPTPWRIAVMNAEAQLAKAQSDLVKANHEATRRQNLPHNYISAEDLDSANMDLTTPSVNGDSPLLPWPESVTRRCHNSNFNDRIPEPNARIQMFSGRL